MAVVSERPGLPLWSEHVRFVRRHRATIAALMGVGLVAGFVWSLGQPASYSATASVVLTPVPKYVSGSTTALTPPEVSIDTDAQLLQGPRVLTAVAAVLHTDPGSASDHLTVTASPHSHVLHVTVTAGSARVAADAADAAVAGLASARRAALGALRPEQLREVRLLIGRQQELVSEVVVVPAYSSLSAQLLELSTGLQELEDARHHPVQAVSAAVPPRHADRANTEVPLTSGVMVGLLCGCLVGAARDRAGPTTPRAATSALAPPPPGDLPAGLHRHEDHHHVV